MIQYVCEMCLIHSPEICGRERDELRVTPQVGWICEECYNGSPKFTDDDDAGPRVPYWSSLPIPPEYAPVSDAGKKMTMKIKIWSKPGKWESVNARAVASGSPAQMANVLQMALDDLQALARAVPSKTLDEAKIRDCMETIRFSEPKREPKNAVQKSFLSKWESVVRDVRK